MGARQQYYFRPSDDGFDAWDVSHLIELSASLPVKELPLGSIRELDPVYRKPDKSGVAASVSTV